jgi:hypothetical protein
MFVGAVVQPYSTMSEVKTPVWVPLLLLFRSLVGLGTSGYVLVVMTQTRAIFETNTQFLSSIALVAKIAA